MQSNTQLPSTQIFVGGMCRLSSLEVGEKSTPSSDIRNINLLDTTDVQNWMASGTDRQVTKTIYDNPINLDYQDISTSRKRVIASIYLENKGDVEGDSTLYGYDILGNVSTLVQHIKALAAVDATNGKKRVDYDYDLVSGKVNMVSYQSGKGDQFFYKYLYDADNRVISSYTSRDNLVWTEDAGYTYYLHGPLARTEIGNYKVQGVDYAYTLQGWLKGINSDSLSQLNDIANDGRQNAVYGHISRDVYGFKLGYYNNDYVPIGGAGANAFAAKSYTAPTSLDNSGNQLFNGNISYSTIALSKINSAATTGYSYGYDQLNRLVEMRQHTTGTNTGWSNSNIITAYRESIAYDANGNILKYLRNGTAATLNMDSLNYKYNLDAGGQIINNKLNYVTDNVSSSNYSVDIDNQSPNNYDYDLIGNLKKDVSEGIDTIRWTVYGKINRIVKNGNTFKINYGYDAGGNRTTKIVSGAADTTTFYVRDAQGNVLAIYTKNGSDDLHWSEQDLYGSSRLGIWKWDTTVPTSPPIVDTDPIYDSLLLGARTYELTNHLGNVLATISDKKIGNDSSGTVNYYIAEVLSQNDYYPGGMLMPGRGYNVGNYRYGFGGQEMSNEIKATGNSYTAEFWEYDPRLVRRWNVDPVQKAYESPYAAFGNNPIWNVDPNGADTAKYLSNGQLLDAIKIGYNQINTDIKNKQYNIRNDRSKQLEASIMKYLDQHQDMTFGAIAEFRETAYNYFEGLNQVAFASGKSWENLGQRLNNPYISDRTNILQTVATIQALNGFGLHVATMGANVAMGIAAGSVGFEAGPGPRGVQINSSTQQALVNAGGKDIALGVNENLAGFAKTVGGETWKTWGPTNFTTKFNQVINNSSNRIHFNLTGPDGNMINVWQGVTEGAQGFQASRATSWELYQLYINPGAQSRTTFYHNGSVVPNPFKH